MRRRVPSTRDVPWAQLRRRATVIFIMLQAGWTALSADERAEARQLVAKSRGRPRNLTQAETKRLGQLARRAATAAARKRPR
jgi:hypothetical protein